MLSLPCTAYDRILLCLFLVFLTLFWAFLSFQIHPRAGDLSVVAADMDAQNVMNAFIDLVPGHKEVADETVTMLFAVDGAIGEDAAVRQVATVLDDEIGALQIDDDWNTDIGSVGDHTTLHYTYTGSVSITNRALADNHGMSLNIIAVQITRTANA